MYKMKGDKMLISNLKTYFEEKQLPYELFEIEANGDTHLIDNETIIEEIGNMPVELQKKIRDKITTIDFYNGNINYFLKDIAEYLINNNK